MLHPSVSDRISREMHVLATTDGRTQSDGAIRAGALYAGTGRPLDVLTVVSHSAAVLNATTTDVEAERAETSRQAVAEQIRRLLPESLEVTIHVEAGTPASAITDMASKVGATMIATGIGRHRVIDRAIGSETAIAIAQRAPVPLLAAPPDFARRPRHVVIGTDFSESSIDSAILATHLASDSATIYVVHVSPYDYPFAPIFEGRTALDARTYAALERVIMRLPVRERQHVQAVLRHGDPVAELLQYARDTAAELIATGAHSRRGVFRLLLGSVAVGILRGSTCAVLIAPVSAPNDESHSGAG